METTLAMNDQPLTFTLTRDEIAELNKVSYARVTRIGNAKRKMDIANWVMSLLVVIGIASLLRFYDAYNIDFTHLNVSLIFFALGFIGFIVFGSYQRKFFAHHAFSDDGFSLQKQTVSFSEDGVAFKTIHSSYSFGWEAINDSESTDSQIYLYIDNYHALHIPKRALGDGAGQARWIAYINEQLVKVTG